MQKGDAIGISHSHVRLGDAIGHGVDRLKSLNAQEAESG